MTNRFKKKLLSLIVAVSLVIGAMPSAAVFADGAEYTQNTAFDKAWSVTKGLGINPYDDSERTQKMTRADFAIVLYNAFLKSGGRRNTTAFTKDGGSDSFAEHTAVFSDVSPDDYGFAQIGAIASVGFMSGDGNGFFNPTDNVTNIQVLKTLLTIGGYDSVAVTDSDWQIAYYKLAKKLYMCLDAVDTDAELAKEETMEVFFNFLQVRPLSATGITNNSISYSSRSNDTVLKELLDIDLYEGQMTYNGYSYITYDSEGRGGEIIVDGVNIKTDGTVPTLTLLGREVEAYCDGNGVLIYAYVTDSDDITVIDAKDIENFDGDTIEYADNNRTRKIGIKGYPVVMNGRAIAAYDSSLLDFEFGSIVISDELKYVSIIRYENLVVSSIDSFNNTLYSENTNKTLAADDSDEVYIYGADGGKMFFSDIEINNTVLAIDTKGYKELHVSDRVVSGTLESIDSGNGIITVSSKNYNLADCVNADDFSVSSNVELYINTMGYVAYMKYKLASNDFIYGYVTRSGSTNALRGEYKSKIFSEDGKFYTYEYAPKIKLCDSMNNTSTIDVADADTAFGAYRGLVRYKLNIDGKISNIELPLKSKQQFTEGQDRLYEKYVDSTGNNCYRIETKSFGYDTYLDGSVKIFSVPDDLDSEDDFTIVDMDELVDVETNTLYAYYNEFETAIPEAVVLNNRSSKNTPIPTTPRVVTRIYSSITDGDVYDCAVLQETDSKSITVKAKREGGASYFDKVKSFVGLGYHKLEVGDIVACTYNAASFEVQTMALIFSANAEGTGGSGANKGRLTDCGYIAGEQRYSDKYFIYSDLYNEFMSGATKFDDIASAIAPVSANALSGQNPLRVSTKGVPRANAHASYGDGYVFMLGYAVDKGNMFVKLTTQDLSASDYIANGIPEIEDSFVSGTTAYTGIYFQRYHKLTQTWAKHLLVEYTDKGVSVRNANFNDIFTYAEAGRNCSRVLVYRATNYIVINDYRSKGGN